MAFFRPKNDSMVIASFDGKHWRARLFEFKIGARGGTRVGLRMGSWETDGYVAEAASRNNRKIPKQILEFAVAAKAKRLRVLMTADLHSIRMELPEDAEKEEVHTALVFESAGETGADANSLRIAAVRADRYRMGGEPTIVVTAGFETSLIDGFVRDCETAGIEFDCIGALEMAILACHARKGDDDTRLLLLRRQSGFYAVPAFDVTPFSFYSLPVGMYEDKSESAAERAERSAKRLAAQRDLPLRVVTCGSLDGGRAEALRSVTGEAVECVNLYDIDDEIMRHTAHVEPGVTEAGCALVGPAPAPRDPCRAGTWMAVFILLMAGLYVTLVDHSLRKDAERQAIRETAWKKLVAEREKATKRRENANKQFASLQEREKLLKGNAFLPKPLTPLMDALAAGTPPFSRMTRIMQTGDEEFVVYGITRFAEGLVALGSTLQRYGLTNQYDTVKNAGDQEFHFRIQQTQDRRHNLASRSTADGHDEEQQQ